MVPQSFPSIFWDEPVAHLGLRVYTKVTLNSSSPVGGGTSGYGTWPHWSANPYCAQWSFDPVHRSGFKGIPLEEVILMNLDPHSKCSCSISILFHLLSSCLECLTFIPSHCLLRTLSIFSLDDFSKPSGISGGPTFAPPAIMRIFLCVIVSTCCPLNPWVYIPHFPPSQCL